MKIVQTYASPEANTFDVIINDNVVAYYYEHFVNPETNEKLNTSGSGDSTLHFFL